MKDAADQVTRELPGLGPSPEPTAHHVRYDEQGHGNTASLTPHCTCGWRGVAAYAYNDDQLTSARAQAARHVREATSSAIEAPFRLQLEPSDGAACP